MRRNRISYLLLGLALDLAHAAPPRDAVEDLHALLTHNLCPPLLLPQECHSLRGRLSQASSSQRSAILADYLEILHEREQACRCRMGEGLLINAHGP